MLEAIRALELDKNNIVRFVESFRFNDLSCLVIEMLDMSLMDLMRDQSPVGLCEKDALTENFSGRNAAIERFNAQDHVEPVNIINICDGDTGDLDTGSHNAYNSESDNIEPIGTFQAQKYDILVSDSTRYLVMDFSGEGPFGKVAKCLNLTTTEMVAVKIHTQKEEEFIQREVCMLEEIRALDPEKNNIVRFVEYFWFNGLSCLVFEMLDRSLFDLMIERKEAPLRIISLTRTKTDMELTENSLTDLFRGYNADFEMYRSEDSIEFLPRDDYVFFSVDDDYSDSDINLLFDEDTEDLDTGPHNAYNSEADNINPSRTYQVQKNDVLLSDSTRYLVMDFNGEGAFGKVAQCLNLSTNERVAVKIHTQNEEHVIQREVYMLEAIRALDPEKNNIVRFVESFRFNGLSFLVFEMLDRSLWDLVKESRTPLRLNEIRPVIHQLLVAFDALKGISVIHTDLKPDNIMLVNNKDRPYRVKLIDFGLAIPANLLKTGNTVQPCGYRAPEAILGLPLSEAIDMWGVGCIMAFLCFGQHLFPVDCLYHCMTTMVQMLGQPEDHLVSAGIKSLQYFSKEEDSSSPGWRLKSPEEFKKTTEFTLQLRYTTVHISYTTVLYRVFPAGVQQLLVIKEEVSPEWSPSLDQEDSKPLHIKEEQEELLTSQEGKQVNGLEEADITVYPFTTVTVKSEDDEEKPPTSQLHPRQRLHAGVQQLLVIKEEVSPEWSPSLDQEDSKPLHIKEEQEELWTSQEGKQVNGLEEADITMYPFTAVTVKSEDEEKPPTSQLQPRQIVIDMSAMESSLHNMSKKKRMKRNLNTAEALKMFHNLDSGDSDGGNPSELGNESDLSWVHEDTSSESDSESVPRKKRRLSLAATAHNAQGLPEPALEPTGVLSPLLVSSQPEAAVEKGKDGTVWMVLQPDGRPGRRQSQNVLTEAAGPTAHAKRNVEDALTAFLCVFDDGMLKHIRDCTVAEAHRDHGNSSWDLTVAELKAFIALLYVRGAQCAKNIELDSLWSEKWGIPFFRQTMARNRFRDIMRFLRFDRKETRRVRLQDDKFALVRATWDRFIQNSVACYKPGANITIDEQLFPTKARCKFTQYMGNKPGKFGIKFWLAADVDSKYMVNGSPYLGKEETRNAGWLVGENVVLRLVEPFLGKGRNITTNNFFTSLKLATALQAKKTSLVGTMSKQKQELPPSVKQQAELFNTKVLKCGDATLTVYQGKPRKNVCILSTVHTGVGTFSGAKAKPESAMYYNNTKYGVGVLDQMARAYSVKGGTRRWPVAVFYNILDLAGINAHILFKECTSSRIARRTFLQQLAEELRAEYMEGKGAARQSAQGGPPQQQQTQKRRQCQVRRNCKQNKTSDTCSKCHKPACGNCARRAEVICVNCDH
ncbi:uncharacterized protein [Pagrus major]|uniref:uncharacterized protein n=1 Tax=Pagrus major TaxID=143350 RepID=UPI003CC871C0